MQLQCVICGTVFKTTQWEINHGRLCCSPTCGYEIRRIRQLGNFWLRVDKSTRHNGCWIWTGKTDKDGYGRFCYQATNHRAHRFSWILCRGEIPDGLNVLHHCDNPPCINPSHLWLGTNLENTADMVSKNRQLSGNHVPYESRIRGEQHHKSKLSASDVIQIRSVYSTGTMTQQQLAERYGIGQGSIGRIVNRKYWTHI